MNPDFSEFLPLASKIAQSFSNIPGLDSREIEMRAQEALADAMRKYDSVGLLKSFRRD